MQFSYEAKTQEGVPQRGFVEAGSQEGAVDILQQRKLIVISVSEAATKEIGFSWKKIANRVSLKEVSIFSRQFATLFSAKVPIVESLNTLAEQESNPYFREVIESIAHEVESGTPLSRALLRYPNVFSDFFVQIVHSGEVSGKLGDVFQYLADYLERDLAVRQKTRGALIYPAFILLALSLVMVVLMVYVMPQLTSMLQDAGESLPLITRIIINFGNFVRDFWWVAALIVLLGIVFGWRYVRTPGGRAVADRLMLDFPILGKLFQKIYMMRFSETLSVLLVGGLSLPQALEITRDVVGNTIYAATINKMVDAVREGSQMSRVLLEDPYVPRLVGQMVLVGENTGRLEDMLRHISKFYQSEVDNAVSNLTSAIEPLMIIIIGIAVGAVVVGVILPIYNLAGSF